MSKFQSEKQRESHSLHVRLSLPPKLRFRFDTQITSCLPTQTSSSTNSRWMILQRRRSDQTLLLPYLDCYAIVIWRRDTDRQLSRIRPARDITHSLGVSKNKNKSIHILFHQNLLGFIIGHNRVSKFLMNFKI